MGGVCTGGTLKRSTAAECGGDNGNLGFSGKLRPVKSFGQQKKNNSDYTDGNGSGSGSDDLGLSSAYPQDDHGDDDVDVYHRKTTSYDSGELFSISRELKPSTPARAGAIKDNIL